MQKILVIDDSKMIRMRVKDMLPSDNVEVVEARDGKEGLQSIKSEQPQLIILDFLLPKLSGWEVYQELQNDANLEGIPLVIMSGRKEEVTEKISEPFENFAFVEKPFEQNQLVQAIKDAKAKANQKATMPPEPEAEAEAETTSTEKASDQDIAALQTKMTELENKLQTLEQSESQPDVTSLQTKVSQMEEKMEKMQRQIDQLHKQMNQLVTFIKKKLN